MTDPIADGYAQSTPHIAAERAQRRDRDLAAGFLRDDRMERLIALRSEDRAEFNSIAYGGIRMALANYERAKAAHAKYGN